MDEKLKDAIAAVRVGDKATAQRQLTALLDEDPQQDQGWYLLSLLVDSPQKQATYLSKTLALNPAHEKAKEQLAALQATSELTPTTTIHSASKQPMDVLEQSDTDKLPDWLIEQQGDSITAVPVEEMQKTAVSNEELPDWLREPSMLDEASQLDKVVAEAPTIVGKTAEPATKSDQIAADLKQTLDKPQQKQAKAPRPKKKETRNLNIMLGILVMFALIIIVWLAYLLLN